MANNVSTVSTALKWGLIVALILIIFNLIVYVLGLAGNQAIGMLTLPILFLLIFLAVKGFRDSNGTMSVGQGITVGVLVGLFSGIILAIYNYVFLTFIDPTFMQGIIDTQEQKFYEQGMDDEQIEQAIGMMKKFTNPALSSVISLFSNMFMGLLFSLIPAFVFKREHDSKY